MKRTSRKTFAEWTQDAQNVWHAAFRLLMLVMVASVVVGVLLAVPIAIILSLG